MAFTVQDFGDRLRLLEEHPEWRSELRRHVVSDELLELPALVRALVEAQRSTDKRIERLTEQLKGLAQRVDHLAVQVEALVQVQMRTEQRLTDLDARYR